jgi:hypothetical protein
VTDDFQAVLSEAAIRQSRKIAAAIDEACLRAMIAGTGVLVLTKDRVPTAVMVTPDVPAGKIHYREQKKPSLGGYRAQHVILDEIGDLP